MGTIADLMRYQMQMWAHCLDCAAASPLDMKMLAKHLGPDWDYVGRIPPGLVCTRCGSKRAKITLAANMPGYTRKPEPEQPG